MMWCDEEPHHRVRAYNAGKFTSRDYKLPHEGLFTFANCQYRVEIPSWKNGRGYTHLDLSECKLQGNAPSKFCSDFCKGNKCPLGYIR